MQIQVPIWQDRPPIQCENPNLNLTFSRTPGKSGLVLFNGQEQYTLKGTPVINPMIHEGIETL